MAEVSLDTVATVPAGTTLTVTVREQSSDHTDSQVVGDGTNSYTLTGFTGESNLRLELEFTSTGEDTATLDSASAAYQSTASEPPEAASNLAATDEGDGTAALTWTDNSSDDSQESGFEVFHALSSGSSVGDYTLVHTTGPDVTSYTHAGAAEDDDNFYRVRATNTVGNSALSAEAHVGVGCLPPSGVGATNDPFAFTIHVTWTDESSSEIGHTVYRDTSPGVTTASTEVGNVPAGQEGFSDDSPDANTTYYYMVVAEGTNYDSQPSAEASASTLNGIQGTVTLAGSPVSGAKLYAIDQSDNSVAMVRGSGPDGTYDLTPLPSGTYHVVVEYADEGTYYTDESQPFITI